MVKQEEISFRDLLERVLPLHQLPPPERLRVERALQSGVAGQLEEAALYALRRLEEGGALRKLPGAPSNGERVVRYEPSGGLEIITVRLPGAGGPGEVVAYPRQLLPARARASLDQVRRLLGLDELALADDPRAGQGRASLLAQLDSAGRGLIGAGEFRFYALDDGGQEDAADPPLDAELGRDACARPGAVLYCADAWASPQLKEAARRRGVRSIAAVAVAGPDRAAGGHLEARCAEPARFGLEDLAMISLLADRCGAMLERAARIERLVFVDPLTGAFNKSFYDLQIQNEMARAQRERTSVALCIVDIDDFKAFNTSYGYRAGNEVLERVAHALRHGVRPFDTVARWGGEEFAVLLTPPIHRQDVGAVCERLRRAVEQLVVTLEGLDRRRYQAGVTVSMGVALYPEHADSAEELWRAANRALLAAKRPPKNRIVFAAAAPREGSRPD
jgi:diguanylate cyclase (GGDEF)-like protein